MNVLQDPVYDTQLDGWRGTVAMIALACVMLPACKPVPEHQRGTVPVSGTVTLGGSPVPGATVSFVAAKEGRSASAITDANGRYSLTTFRRGDGALPGDYTVAISKYEVVTGGATGKDYVPVQGEVPEPKSELPKRYAQPGKSGLKATVTSDAKANVFDFSLSP